MTEIKKNILIFGGLGLVGLEIANHLIKKNNVTVVDVVNKKEFVKSKIAGYVNYIQYKNYKQLKTIYNKIYFYAVIHCLQFKSKNFINHDLFDLDLKSCDQIYNVNLKIPLISTHLYIKQVKKYRNVGRIINFSSTYGVISSSPELYYKTNMGNPVYYTISKFSLIGLTKYIASYFKKYNILCNSISPHGIENDHKKKFIENFSKRSPLGRLSQSKEILPAIDFLLSEHNTYTNGANIAVDGGWTAC